MRALAAPYSATFIAEKAVSGCDFFLSFFIAFNSLQHGQLRLNLKLFHASQHPNLMAGGQSGPRGQTAPYRLQENHHEVAVVAQMKKVSELAFTFAF